MCKVNVLEAKTNLSKLISLLENEEEEEIIICKNNNPIATIKLIPKLDVSKRLGIAKGNLIYPEEFTQMDDEIASMFIKSEIF